MTPPENRLTLYQEITQNIISALEAADGNTLPWVKPWQDSATLGPFRNAASGLAYKGINPILLGISSMVNGFTDPRFLTFKQAAEAGFRIKKGSKGSKVVFFKMHPVEDKHHRDTDGNPVITSIPIMQSYIVFNAQQIEGLPPLQPEQKADWNPIAAADKLIADSKAEIRIGQSNQAYYSPAGDYISIPDRAQFSSAEGFYSTLIHELCHWSGGGENRLNRHLSSKFGSEGYALEELIAEMGSVMTMASLQIPYRLEQHASYIQNWLQALKSDSTGKLIFRMASEAQKAADFLQGTYTPKTKISNIQPQMN